MPSTSQRLALLPDPQQMGAPKAQALLAYQKKVGCAKGGNLTDVQVEVKQLEAAKELDQALHGVTVKVWGKVEEVDMQKVATGGTVAKVTITSGPLSPWTRMSLITRQRRVLLSRSPPCLPRPRRLPKTAYSPWKVC